MQTKKVYLLYANCFLNLETIELHLQNKFKDNKFVHSFIKADCFMIKNTRCNLLHVFLEFEHKMLVKSPSIFSFYDSRTQDTYCPHEVTSITTNKLLLINKLLEYGRNRFVTSKFKVSPELKAMIESKYFTDFEILNQFLKKDFIGKVSRLLKQNTHKNASQLDDKAKTLLLNFLKIHYKKS